MKKGEHGIRILAPIIRKMEEEREGKIEEVRRPVSFRVVSVFDVAQTEGEPLAELECNPTEGGETLLPLLEKAPPTFQSAAEKFRPVTSESSWSTLSRSSA